jgi:hypothetical protein
VPVRPTVRGTRPLLVLPHASPHHPYRNRTVSSQSTRCRGQILSVSVSFCHILGLHTFHKCFTGSPHHHSCPGLSLMPSASGVPLTPQGATDPGSTVPSSSPRTGHLIAFFEDKSSKLWTPTHHRALARALSGDGFSPPCMYVLREQPLSDDSSWLGLRTQSQSPPISASQEALRPRKHDPLSFFTPSDAKTGAKVVRQLRFRFFRFLLRPIYRLLEFHWHLLLWHPPWVVRIVFHL